jgi:protein-disulfide isomerase
MEQQMYLVRRNALGAVVDEKLLEAEAKKKGLSVADLLKTEVDVNVPDPTADEVSAYYQMHQNQINQPFDDVKSKIEQGLKTQGINKARQAYTQGLVQQAMENGDLVLLLHAPNVELSYDPARLRGSPDAPVTIIEFSDFSCPFCRKAEPNIAEVLSKYEGKVKLGYRDFPLRQIHPQAELAAEASRCAGEQGKYWEFHDLLFANPAEKQDRDSLREDARSLKLDEQNFDSCLNSGRSKPQIEEDLQLGTRAGVVGTPAFFVNGVFLNGAQPVEAFERIIEQELSSSSTNPNTSKKPAAN